MCVPTLARGVSSSAVKRTLVWTVVAYAALTARPEQALAEEFTRRRLVLPEGAFEITGEPARPKILGINMSDERVFEPVYIAPHFYWGVSDHVTIGITHDRGLCVTGPTRGCGDRPYNDVGFGMLVGLVNAQAFELDLHMGVPVGNFDPFMVGIKSGMLGRIRGDVVAFVFDPFLYVGLSERDQGNREALVLPFWFYFQATPRVAPFVGAAVQGPLDNFGDLAQIPVEGGVVFEVSNNVDLGFVFRFNNLLGNDGGPDSRDLGMLARFRF